MLSVDNLSLDDFFNFVLLGVTWLFVDSLGYVECIGLVKSPHFLGTSYDSASFSRRVTASLNLSREFAVYLVLSSSRARFSAVIPEGRYLPELTPAQRLVAIG